ncbi:hypothetical protein CspeluHIS016_0800360 [Cutaneotrichosporon spelunceum]|uniref:Membrane-associated proteins in eicosanoid and glutathione metabolism n=1 Tax=Cutaneotrichosporon spelunceum TaxID=1672016 RepID=A0AAD3TYW5_9TREE|nr:hypothetical protein CspeluHIS016_0800360 [Cutaneotrichosporon spelunceum]
MPIPDTPFTLPSTFPVMGVGVLAVVFLNIFQARNVGVKRAAAGVKYPAAYASEEAAKADPKKNVFNCAQRAHANTLEFIPSLVGMFAYVGCFHPLLATGSLLVWVISRVGYTINYSTGEPAKRVQGISRIGALGGISLVLSSIYITATEVHRLFLS